MGEGLHLHPCFQPLSPHTEVQGGSGFSHLGTTQHLAGEVSPGNWLKAAAVSVGQGPPGLLPGRRCPCAWPLGRRCSWAPGRGRGSLQAVHRPAGL